MNRALWACKSLLRPPVSPTANRSFSSLLRQNLERLEERANQHAHDPNVQAKFLRELGKTHPQLVVKRVESGAYAANDSVFREYVKSLVATRQLDRVSIDSLLRPLGLSAPQYASGATQQHQHHMNDSAASRGIAEMMGNRAMMGTSQQAAASSSWNNGYGGSFNPFNYQPGGVNGMAAAATAANHGANGAATSEASPVHVQLVEANFRTQMWKTFRLLLGAFVVISGLSMLVDEKAMPRGMGLNKEVQPAADQGKTFADVKGAEEAKNELQEIVAYLRNPDAFTRLGGKLPKGVLLTGPPGTGKTLLAKAIAGEAQVPFYYASGSEFEEMYVGVGARRVRDLFAAAKKKSPCIVFIDEIDAIGSTRALKEQNAMKMTLNQLLVELDGFKETEGVIIIGATNFPETLDPALIRPGRFDRNVVVPLPDIKGRRDILTHYLTEIPKNEDVDIQTIARGTPGASGAELANLVNIAALHASQKGADDVSHKDLEYAKDKILMGAERKSAVIPDDVRRVTAFHEGGHALVAIHTNGAMPIHKATIMPRGQALGMVHQLPEEQDMLQRSKRQMLAELDVCMGGRVAEELILGADDITSGASSDIQKATQIARRMVSSYGMDSSGNIGVMFVPNGRDASSVSDETKNAIDEEVRRLLQESYTRAKKLLVSKRKELDRLAAALMEHETLTSDQVKLVIQGKKIV